MADRQDRMNKISEAVALQQIVQLFEDAGIRKTGLPFVKNRDNPVSEKTSGETVMEETGKISAFYNQDIFIAGMVQFFDFFMNPACPGENFPEKTAVARGKKITCSPVG